MRSRGSRCGFVSEGPAARRAAAVAFVDGLRGFAGCFGFVESSGYGDLGVCGGLMWVGVGPDTMSPAAISVGFFDGESIAVTSGDTVDRAGIEMGPEGDSAETVG